MAKRINTPSKLSMGGSYLDMKRSSSRVTIPSKKYVNTGDRFIPSHVDLDRPVISENFRACTLNFESLPEKKSSVKHAFRDSMFGHTPSKVLSFGSQWQHASNHSVLTASSPGKTTTKSTGERRQLPTEPSRILDAPGLVDDFYINPLAWSSNDVLAIALNGDVYTGDMFSNEIKVANVYKAPGGHYVSSVEWVGTCHLAVGLSYGRVKIVDVEEAKVIRTLRNHSGRVASMSWSVINSLASGGRDGKLVHSDLRQEHPVATKSRAHSGEICQVRWSPNEKNLGTGANDDQVAIWDVTSMATPSVVFAEHEAAVKAIAWNPHDHSMIATGGGTADKAIKLWNIRNGTVRKSVTTDSQVCCMLWNPHAPELLTGHGYGQGESSLNLWKCPSITPMQTFKGQNASRPLAMAMCPSGSRVCVASTDDCLRIWDMFQPLNKRGESYARSFGDNLPLSDGFWDSMQIR